MQLTRLHTTNSSHLIAIAAHKLTALSAETDSFKLRGDLPKVSSNSATATKIFAQAVLLKTILNEKLCTYSTNRAWAITFRRIMLSVHWC